MTAVHEMDEEEDEEEEGREGGREGGRGRVRKKRKVYDVIYVINAMG